MRFGVVVIPLRNVSPEAGCAEVSAVPGFTVRDGYPPDGVAAVPRLQRSRKVAPRLRHSRPAAPRPLPAPRAEPPRSRSASRCSTLPAGRSPHRRAHPRVRRQRSTERHLQSACQGQSRPSDRSAGCGAGLSFVRETRGSALATAVALIARAVGREFSSRDLLLDVVKQPGHISRSLRETALAPNATGTSATP